MSDLFHEKVPFLFIDKVLNTINAIPWHRYQLLTKRAGRMAKYFETRIVPDNVWLGVTVETQEVKARIEMLGKIPAAVLNLADIDWVIVGGESGKRARPMKEECVLSIERQANAGGSAFFFKRWGTWGADGIKRGTYANGKLLKGKIRQAMPVCGTARK
jgi:protein gp37